ncbi:unnamed protein product [Linum trigynum]|uniref:SWIM-type domain-containing protein n=1 Tax=Linum trigynum TaxID=586398 RepID=A0AAV2ER69_9ROSI
MYPIAWAVMEGENANSWRWFVNILSQELGLTDGRGWTIISDQQKGLIEATHELLPDAEHRKCACHVYANWKAKNKTDRVRELFWKAVYACNENDWKKATKEMETIEGTELGSTPFTDFMAAEPRSFCRAFMSTMSKCDSVERNICETFNGTIVKYRGLRIIDMLEGIRLYMMDRFVIKYNILMDTPDMLCPRIRKRVEKVKEFARLCIARQTLADRCEVKMGENGYIVDLNDMSCTCGYWQLSGLPCCHAVSAISHMRKEVDDYVHPCYKAHHVEGGYRVGIACLDGRQACPNAIGLAVHPPKQRAMPGRPKKKRRRAAHELETRPQRNGVGEEVTRRGSIIYCKKCGVEGHNSRGCKATEAEIQVSPRRASRTAGTPTGGGNSAATTVSAGNNTAAPTVPAGNNVAAPTVLDTRRKRFLHCSKCQSATHNARTYPLNRGNGIQDVVLNVGDRRTIEREMRVATRGIGVYLNGSRGRPAGGTQPIEMDAQGSQPPPTQP